MKIKTSSPWTFRPNELDESVVSKAVTKLRQRMKREGHAVDSAGDRNGLRTRVINEAIRGYYAPLMGKRELGKINQNPTPHKLPAYLVNSVVREARRNRIGVKQQLENWIVAVMYRQQSEASKAEVLDIIKRGSMARAKKPEYLIADLIASWIQRQENPKLAATMVASSLYEKGDPRIDQVINAFPAKTA